MPPASARRRPADWAAGLLLAFLLALAFRGALSGRLFYLRDVVQNHAPMRAVVTERIASGDLPLWDPLHGGGTPLLANPNHLVLHPITLLFLVLPFDRAFTLSILLQYAVLAAGGWLLARSLGLDRPAAFLVAALLALSGPAASLSSQQNVLSAFAWLPLALWGFTRAATSGSRIGRLTAVLATAIVLLTGEAASTLALLVLAPILAIAAPGIGAAGPAPRPAGPGLALVAAGLLLAGLVAAAGLLPARALLAESARGNGLDAADALRWSLEPVRLLELALPRFFGDPTHLSPGAWWGGWRFAGGFPFMPSIVVGAGACLLALAALGRGPLRRPAFLLAGAGLLFLLLALGSATPLLPALRRGAPVFALIRYPERFLLGLLLPLALLAGFGLDRLVRRRGASRAGGLAAAAAALILACATVLVAVPERCDAVLAAAFALPPALLAAGGPIAEIRGGVLRSLVWALADTALLAGAVIAMRRGGLKPAAAAWGVAAAIGVSVTLASDPARTTAAAGWLHAPSPLLATLETAPPRTRLHHAPRPPDLQIWARSDEQIWGFRFDRFTYALLTGHPDGVATALDPATDRLDLAASPAIGARLDRLPAGPRARILRTLGVGWYAAWEPIEDAALEPATVLEDLSRPPLRLYRVREPLPRFRLVGRTMPPPVPGDPVASLLHPSFDPERDVLIDRPGAAVAAISTGARTGEDPGSAPAAAPGTVEVLQDDPERVRISVTAATPAVLVVGDAYASGWRALIDGEPAGIDRANLVYRAITVPAGRHEVTMEYRPLSLQIGAGLSALGLAGSAAWASRRAVTA